jgi:hypothetical protein
VASTVPQSAGWRWARVALGSDGPSAAVSSANLRRVVPGRMALGWARRRVSAPLGAVARPEPLVASADPQSAGLWWAPPALGLGALSAAVSSASLRRVALGWAGSRAAVSLGVVTWRGPLVASAVRQSAGSRWAPPVWVGLRLVVLWQRGVVGLRRPGGWWGVRSGRSGCGGGGGRRGSARRSGRRASRPRASGRVRRAVPGRTARCASSLPVCRLRRAAGRDGRRGPSSGAGAGERRAGPGRQAGRPCSCSPPSRQHRCEVYGIAGYRRKVGGADRAGPARTGRADLSRAAGLIPPGGMLVSLAYTP